MNKPRRFRVRPLFFLIAAAVCLVLLLAFLFFPAIRTLVDPKAALLAELQTVLEKNPDLCSDGFDFPVGPPEGKGYYIALHFGERRHLGEDWNGVRGGNSDLGDPVYSCADGYVVFASDHGGGWGNVIRIVHFLLSPSEPGPTNNNYVETLYAHCLEIKVKKRDLVERGRQIGTMGNVNGRYYAHLHLELRSDIFLPIGNGYSDLEGFQAPTDFIKKNRPQQ